MAVRPLMYKKVLVNMYMKSYSKKELINETLIEKIEPAFGPQSL